MPSRTRLLLVSSLGGLLLLIALTAVAALAVFSRIQTREAALRTRFAQRSAWLEKVRSGVYLSGTLARDYAADPDGPDAPALAARLKSLERETREALDRVDAPRTLRGDVVTYWRVLNLMSEMAERRPAPAVDAYFRHQLALRRETMLRIADSTAAALDAEMARGAQELERMYTRLRWTLAAGLALIASLGLALAIFAGSRMIRLEREARALSAQLVSAQEQERRSLARELHDEIGQALSRILLDLGNARVESAAVTAEQTVDSIRRIALALRPSMLDDLGLVPALEWQAREVARRSGLNVEVHADDSAAELPEPQRTCIYRVAQEALENCVRHARANRIQVSLRRSEKTTTLEVTDDGRGFSPKRTRGLGLLGMAERAAQLGGRFRAASAPGHGTVITMELPA